MNVFIDASNLGGGGGVTHLAELLAAWPGETPVTVLARQKVLQQLPQRSTHRLLGHPMLEKGLLRRVLFQLFLLDRMIPDGALVFAVTGDYLGRRQPVVSMSQNMLIHEREIWKEFRNFRECMRFRINYLKQWRSFSRSAGILFISGYARDYISARMNLSQKTTAIIHHGIHPRFFGEVRPQRPREAFTADDPCRLVYVSTVHVYKHPWSVIEAAGLLREAGYPVSLTLAGAVIFEPAGKRMMETLDRVDPGRRFVRYLGEVAYAEIEKLYAEADCVLFASTCENMPNILLESMASGTPVASSAKMPMPEFLRDGGWYFDATDPASIARAVASMIDSPGERALKAAIAQEEARKYSWRKAADETLAFLMSIHDAHQRNSKGEHHETT